MPHNKEGDVESVLVGYVISAKIFVEMNVQEQSGSKPFDTLMVFLKEFFEKVDFEKKSVDDKKSIENYPACKELM